MLGAPRESSSIYDTNVTMLPLPFPSPSLLPPSLLPPPSFSHLLPPSLISSLPSHFFPSSSSSLLLVHNRCHTVQTWTHKGTSIQPAQLQHMLVAPSAPLLPVSSAVCCGQSARGASPDACAACQMQQLHWLPSPPPSHCCGAKTPDHAERKRGRGGREGGRGGREGEEGGRERREGGREERRLDRYSSWNNIENTLKHRVYASTQLHHSPCLLQHRSRAPRFTLRLDCTIHRLALNTPVRLRRRDGLALIRTHRPV